MDKPSTIDGYKDAHTTDCERVLVTLLRGLGPWKESVFLVGGLTPRYLIPARPPQVPPHAGTNDVDIVVDVTILLNTEAYHTLEENLKRMNFERSENERHQKLSWQWKAKVSTGATIVLDILTDAPDVMGGKVAPLPLGGNLSAVNIPHSSIVFDMHEKTEIRADLLDGNGVSIETVRYANLVAFTCLKAFAFEHRHQRKDAHDLVYCIENWAAGPEDAAVHFANHLQGKHGAVVHEALGIVRRRFTDDEHTDGHLKDGAVAVARFEIPDADDIAVHEAQALRQRDVAAVLGGFLAAVSKSGR